MVLEDAQETRHEQGTLASLSSLYQRNWAFISPQTQQRLAHVRLLFAGTGLGSAIARAAVQTGFQRFILADGDAVEESNLNRQAFSSDQVGLNKARAIASTIQAISSHAETEVIPAFLTPADFPDLVARSDYIINTIDLTNPAFLDLNREARAQGKVTLFPINLGWGGCLLVFGPHSLSLDDYLAGEGADGTTDAMATALITRVVTTLPGGLPPELARVLPLYASRTPETWPSDPQLGVAAHLTAALTVRAAVALAAGEPVRMAPEVIWVNATTAIGGGEREAEEPATPQAAPSTPVATLPARVTHEVEVLDVHNEPDALDGPDAPAPALGAVIPQHELTPMSVASALAMVSVAPALTPAGRTLVVEPHSRSIVPSLRGAGFAGAIVALASAPISERYDISGGYDEVVSRDWLAHALHHARARNLSGPRVRAETQPRMETPIGQALGTFQSILVTDLTRDMAAADVPEALRWLAGLLEPAGCLALADPALGAEPDALAELLLEAGLVMATDPRVIEGDWPRVLTLWRRRAPSAALKGGVARRFTWEQVARDAALQEQLVAAYQDVFGGDEWGEWQRCARPGAHHAYSRREAAALNPPGQCSCGWPEPLQPYHQPADVLAYIQRDLTPAGTSAGYIRFSAPDASAESVTARQIDAFSWGYLASAAQLARTLCPAAGMSESDQEAELRRQLARYLDTLGAPDHPHAIYYHAELGVREGLRSLSVVHAFIERGLRFAVERGARAAIMRTTLRSPVYRLFTGLGTRPIYWYDGATHAEATDADGSARLLDGQGRRDERVVLACDALAFLEMFSTLSDARLAVRSARGLRGDGMNVKD